MPQTYRLTPDASGRPPVNTRDDRITRIIGDLCTARVLELTRFGGHLILA
jgi:hypothetical protein